MKTNFKRVLSVVLAILMVVSMMPMSFATEDANVAAINGKEYKTLAEAITAAVNGDTITLLDDVNEDVTISKNLTIDGADETYTGKMNLTVDKGTVTIKNVNFDGKGYNGYAVETRGVYYVTIEDCTAKNYSYGFVQQASATVLTTIKNVTVSNMNYGVKVDYGTEVVLENVDITAGVAAVLNSNYGEKTIAIKDSKLNIYGTWTRDNTNKTTIEFEGENTVDQFKIDTNIDTFKLKDGATLAAPEGIDVTTDVADSYVAYENGVYSVVTDANVAAVNGKEYKTLAEAIKAAVNGDTITFLADVTEDVTVSNSVTIDGAGYNYTGTMNLGAGLTITVKNVDFVNAGIIKAKSSTGKYTITDCTFDGNNKEYNYALTIKGANTLKIENCTAKDYSYGFLYVSSSLTNHSMKNVTVENCNYGARLGSTSTSNFENFVTKNVKWPVQIQANSKRTVNLTNCSMENSTDVLSTWGGTSKVTFNFKGINDLGVAELPAAANHVYNAAAQIGTKIYSSLKDAVKAAKDGDVITIVADYKIANSEFATSAVYAQFDSYVEILDKAVTIDFNGKKVTANPELEKVMSSIFLVSATGSLTLKDSSEAQNGGLAVTMGENTQAYSLIFADGNQSKLSIESGDYYIDKVEDGYSMIYAAQTGTTSVSGGNFVLENAGTIVGQNNVMIPWIFNTWRNSENYVEVTGGTYNVNPQNHWNEVIYPNCYKAIENADSTWTVKYVAVAEIDGYGYLTIKDAVAAAKDGDIITLVDDIALENSDVEMTEHDMYAFVSVTDKKVTFDFNGKTITANPSLDKNMLAVFYVAGTGDLTLVDSSADKTGALNVTMANGTKAYSLLTVDGDKSKLTIKSGNYYIDKVLAGYSMIYVAQTGTGFVNGGNFELGNAYSYEKQGAMVPWIFNTYANGKNFVEVKGGTYNVNPQNRWNEVKFPKGYVAYEDVDGIWKVARGPIVVEQPKDTTIGYEKMAQFAPVIKGDNLTYKWYYSDNDGKHFYTSTIKTATYDIKGTIARDGRQVYCVATDSTGKSVTTETVTLTVVPNEELAIVSQPTEVYGALDTTVSIKMDVKGDGLTYKWEFRNKGDKTFQKSSIKTDTYDILLSKDRMDREVRCTITDAFGNQVTSDIITLKAVKTVELKINAQPTYEAVALGEIVKVEMDVQGEYLTYKWYFRNAGSTNWTKSSIKDSEYDLTLSKDRVGREVYCVITDAFGDSIQTETVTLYPAE